MTDPTADAGSRAGRSEPVWVGDLDREIDDLLSDDE
jgi:hypothetical protein